MKAYLSSLNEREKWMIAGAGLCLILYVYYIFLYSPLSHRVNQRSSQLNDKINTLQWMHQVRQQHHSLQPKQKLTNSQLLTTLATQLKKDPALKFPYQLQQTGSGDVQLSFDTVAFNLFFSWLEKINNQYDISVKQFEAERTNTPGVTRLTIILNSAVESGVSSR